MTKMMNWHKMTQNDLEWLEEQKMIKIVKCDQPTDQPTNGQSGL